MTKKAVQTFFVTTFGTFGYASCIFQWLWTLVLLLPSILKNQQVHDFVLPKPATNTPVHILHVDGSSIILTVAAVAVTIIVLMVTAVVLARLPIRLAQASKRAVNKTADQLQPVVSHHQKLSDKKRRQLRYELRAFVKFLIVIVPFLSLIGLLFVPTAVSSTIGFAVGVVLAVGSLLWFSLEYLSAYSFKISFEDIV